jgi:exodeoxyribonuclease VII large subunit
MQPSAPENVQILTVSQLTRQVKALLEDRIGAVWVSGEISNWRVSPAGHAYFTLKDKDSQLSAVCFKGRLSRFKFEPESGLEVILFGQVSVYGARGAYQIICEQMHPKGLGALQLAFEKLKKKLGAEGIFDEAHKKPLPMLPRRIGVVTSPTGAAIRDMLNVIGRRFANVHVLIYPVRVQGEEAAGEIAAAIRALDAYGVDVMIAGRGGGSLEDLWAFNEEPVVRAIFEATTPVISAVGHEIDFTLSDFAADLRAPTPSAAAELVVQEQQALVNHVLQLRARLARSLVQGVRQGRNRLAVAQASYVLQRPQEMVMQRRQRADELRMRLEAAVRDSAAGYRQRLDQGNRALVLLSPKNLVQRTMAKLSDLRLRLGHGAVGSVERSRSRFQPAVAQLEALSPLKILSRGYSVTWKLPEQSIVHSVQDLKVGDDMQIRFASGRIRAQVQSIEEDTDGESKTEI